MSRVIHTLMASAICPLDGLRDYYRVTISTNKFLSVEDIRQFFDSKADERIFQENLTEAAVKTFDADVTLVGVHSGVETTTTGYSVF